MAKPTRKIYQKDIAKCKGLEDPLCMKCKRHSPKALVALVESLKTTGGRKTCIHYIKR